MDLARRENLNALTFGRVAKHFGVSDRVVVYYFPCKEDLITEVLLGMGAQLQETLSQVIPEQATSHLELCQAAWPLLNRSDTPDIDAVFTLFFEANGLAAAGIEPYATVIPQMIHAWIEWVTGIIQGPAHVRRAEAEATVALLDGLLLFRQSAGADATARVATLLGFTQ